jgi:hypothetical protein
MRRNKACPLYPQKRTCAVQLGMSAKCQERTLVTGNTGVSCKSALDSEGGFLVSQSDCGNGRAVIILMMSPETN